jgi:hypothetical protein
MSLLRPTRLEKIRNWLLYPYEAWRHRIFMKGWVAGYEDARIRLLEEQKRTLEEAMSDPFLVILERHPDAGSVANAEMYRAAKRFRSALASVREAQEDRKGGSNAA